MSVKPPKPSPADQKLQDLLGKLQGCEPLPGGKAWRALCPCHQRKSIYLTVEIAGDGVLVECENRCRIVDIAQKLQVDAAGMNRPPKPNEEKPPGNWSKRNEPSSNGKHTAQAPPTASPAAPTYPRPEFGEQWNDPHRLARLFLDAHQHGGEKTLLQWRGEYHKWERGAWVPVPDEELDAQLARHCRAVFTADYPHRVAEAAKAPSTDGKDKKPPAVYQFTTATRANVRANLGGLANRPDTGHAPPFWLDGRDGPDPTHVISAPNGLFRLADIAAGTRPFEAPTPLFFTPNAVPFDVPRAAGQPELWLRCLNEWFDGNAASVAGLQEWFGYLLSADTSAHKALLLVGPLRSGKSTIVRVLTQLVGEPNVASTSFATLGENFGLEDLLGKRLAIIPDARLSGRTDIWTAVERLLSISGEDPQSVNRKNRTRVTTKLGVRFLIATNVIPQLPDASGAIASRFHILSPPNSWLGKEDHAMSDKLKAELPAILVWAAKGWVRFLERRRVFTPNDAAAAYARELADLSSPVRAFVRQRCAIGPEHQDDVSTVYQAWKKWNEDQGREKVTADNIFGRDLRAAFPHIRRHQRRDEGEVIGVYRGIAVREKLDWGESDDQEASRP